MTLTRMQIRHAFRDRLLNKTAVGARVYTTRKRTHWKSKVPALVVYTEAEFEPTQLSKTASPIWLRPLMVAVEAVVDDSEGLPDDELDILCEQVEAAIFGGKRFLEVDAVHDVQPGGTQFRFDGRGEKLYGGARVLFRVPYEWSAPADPLELVAWTHVATDWQFPPPDEVPEAVDLQELDQ